jgi:rubrerythrin
MDAAWKDVAEACRRAIQAEIEGQHFYLMAAQATSDAKGKAIFERLAAEERLHEGFLRAHYDSLLREGTPAQGQELGKPSALEGPNPIFSADLRERIATAHYEMTALAVGVQLERSATDFYRAAAAQAPEPAKGFFTDLAAWEQTHYEGLLRQQEELKEAYWSAGGFAPF